MNFDDYMPLSEANTILGYRGRSTLPTMAKAGKIPGAILVTPRLWMVPKKWVADEVLRMERGEIAGPGKPRGTQKPKTANNMM